MTRTTRIAAILLVLLVAASLLAGCGGSGSSGTTAGSVPADSAQVVMKNIKFVPAELTIKAGQTVTWVNEDSMQHDVVANNGQFKSDLLTNGQTFSFTFSNAGTYPYYCSIHPNMTGVVTVQP